MLSTPARKHAAWGVIFALTAALLLLALYAILTTRALSGQVRACVEPGGRCYREAQAQRMETVNLVNRFTVAAAECARKPHLTDDGVERCIMRHVKADR